MKLGSLKKVFREPGYVVVSSAVAIAVFLFSVWYQNFGLIIQFFKTEGFYAASKIAIGLIASIATNFSLFSAINVILISILFGINVSLLAYFLVKQKERVRAGGVTSGVGIFFGIIGIGCASCGSIILVSILSLFGVSGLIAYLPFGGQEFGFLALILLLYSNIVLLNKISKPLVCEA